MVATILLAVAAFATTWAGYQASLWDGIQSSDYTQASALRSRGSQAHLEANQDRLADLSIIENMVDAMAVGDEALAAFYRERVGPDLEAATVAWLALDPFTNPDAPRSPMAMSEYQPEKEAEAAALIADAEATFESGEEANNISDVYTLATLLLASVLFFAAISERFEVVALRATLLGLAGLALVVGSAVAITQPVTTG
jgi:hypothetical protein